MEHSTVRNFATQVWNLVVAEGVLAILFGIAALFWPGETLRLIVGLFGVFVLVWGIVNLIRSLISIGNNGTWWFELLFSVLTLGLGVFLLRNLTLAIGTFIILAGFTFIVRGVIDLLTAFFSNEESVREVRSLHAVTGVIGVVAGIIVLSQPVASGLAFVWIVGLYAILQGAMVVAISLKARPALHVLDA